MKKTIWALFDNRMGSVGQAKGILQELDNDIFNIKEIQIKYNGLAKLPNIFKGKSLLGTTKSTQTTLKNNEFPDIVLSISRRTAPIARWIKKQSPNTKLIQLMHIGKIGYKEFELIIVSEHDKHKSVLPNIFYTTGCPHRITNDILLKNKCLWEKTFSNLPKPLTAVIVGGAIKNAKFSTENASNLADAIINIKNNIGGSILLTTSRRTGVAAEKIIAEKLKDVPSYSFLWGNKNPNPYLGFLSCADNIIVTGDSVAMCSEACGTGSPVMVFKGTNWLTAKHLRFVDSLYNGGFAIDIKDTNAKNFAPLKTLRTAKDVANKISELI